jgi:hypothetical protein
MPQNRYTVTVQLEFEIYDETPEGAIRQANYGVQHFVLGNEEASANFLAEYPEAPRPRYIPGDFEVIDDEGNVVFKNTLRDEIPEAPKAE